MKRVFEENLRAVTRLRLDEAGPLAPPFLLGSSVNNDHFKDFETLLETGRKAEAKLALSKFLESLSGESDKEDWVHENLPNLRRNRASRIRHEIFEEIVFPVLLRGFNQGCPWHQYWLGRLSQNLISSSRHWAQLDYISDTDLFRSAYLKESQNDEYRKALLDSILRNLNYCDHEWPAGLLGVRTTEDFDELEAEVGFAQSLDREDLFSERFAQFSQRITEYRQRVL